MSSEQATIALYKQIKQNPNITNKLLRVRPVSKSHDEFDTSADAQLICYNELGYWDFPFNRRLSNILEHANYLDLLLWLDLDRLNGRA